MNQDLPGQSGSVLPAKAPANDPIPMTDEELRRFAAERLADHLQIGVDLASRCEGLSSLSKKDKVAPLYAAARLMNANARVAAALAPFANVEQRRRLIVERIQTPDAKMIELNSRFEDPTYDARMRVNLIQKLMDEVEKAAPEGPPKSPEESREIVSEMLADAKRRLANVENGIDEDEGEDEPAD